MSYKFMMRGWTEWWRSRRELAEAIVRDRQFTLRPLGL
jgi:hypothetical protein